MRSFNSFSVVLIVAFVLYHLQLDFNTASISSLRSALCFRLLNKTSIRQSSLLGSLPFSPPSLFAFRGARNMTSPRKVHQAFLAIEQSEGAGARVRRSIGIPKLRNFSPFLMLDHFTIRPGAGFPDQ